MQLFVMAIALGFVSSLPLGPINLYVADSVLSKESIRKFIVGVVAADATIVLAITSFDSDSIIQGIWAAVIWLLSSLAIIAIAVSMLAALRVPEMGKPYTERFSLLEKNSLWLGYAFCIANPAFWAFWFASSTLLANSLEIDLNTSLAGLLVLGVVVGDVAWFSLLVKLLVRSARNLKTNFIESLRTGAAILLLAFALFSFVRSIIKIYEII